MTLTSWTLTLALTLSVFGVATAHAQTFDVRLHSQLLAAGPVKRLTRAEQGRLMGDIRLCERRVSLGLYRAEGAVEMLRSRRNFHTLQLTGAITWIFGSAAAVITSGILGFGLIAYRLGNPGVEPASGALNHWFEPLIPFAGAFIFAGHATVPILIAIGLASGALQAIGLGLLVYATLAKPDSPCDPRVSRGGLEFRF